MSDPVRFFHSFYTSKSQLFCNSFTPRIKLAGKKVGFIDQQSLGTVTDIVILALKYPCSPVIMSSNWEIRFKIL